MMFYLTMPSNSSMEYYPDNHASHYITKLPQPIEVTADYEVGLSEILFSNTYFNLGPDEGWFQFRPDGKSDQHHLMVSEGLYSSMEHLIKEMQQRVSEAVGKKKQNDIKILYSKSSKKIYIRLVKRGGALKISPKLREIFGLTQDFILARAWIKSAHPVQLHKGTEGIFIYCDLVQPRPVGDVMVPLLRIVPAGDRNTDVVHHIFEKPNYIPLSRFQFNTVEILLTNDIGTPLSFDLGKTVVTLHFRRRRPDEY